MITKIHTGILRGIEAVPVVVECEVTSGIGIRLIGLADQAVKESLIRNITALEKEGYYIPGKKIIINVSPTIRLANESTLDLPIALAILVASGQESLPEGREVFACGELGLDASVRAITGSCQLARLAAERHPGAVTLFPYDNRQDLHPAQHGIKYFRQAIRAMVSPNPEQEETCAMNLDIKAWPEDMEETMNPLKENPVSPGALRAATIIAAGGHNAILVGKDTGEKRSLGKITAALLPTPDGKTRQELRDVLSAQGKDSEKTFLTPFVEAPASTSLQALAGNDRLPGMVSLSHGGVLMLPEYETTPKAQKEILRAVLEDGSVTISRLKSTITYPARFLLLAGTKPCPCGNWGLGEQCHCTPGQRAAFVNHALCGALTDHFDVHVFVQGGASITDGKDDKKALLEWNYCKETVEKARQMQEERYRDLPYRTNAGLDREGLEKFCLGMMDQDVRQLIEKLIGRFRYGPKAFSRILKTARTIADLDGSDQIRAQHICEAASYRFLDNGCEATSDNHFPGKADSPAGEPKEYTHELLLSPGTRPLLRIPHDVLQQAGPAGSLL